LAGGWVSVLFDFAWPPEKRMELKGESLVSVDVGHTHDRVASAFRVSQEMVAHGFA
jgi:hypothetical protein